jgi:hypothetical protein
MMLPDGTLKKGMFENNTFIEEITEEDENLESSMHYDDDEVPHHISARNASMNKRSSKKKKKKIKKNAILPSIDTNLNFADQSGRHYASTRKSKMIRNLSESGLKSNSRFKLSSRSKINASESKMKRSKNTLSLPKIGQKKNESQLVAKLQGFTNAAKNQASERKKLDTYFKSLDRAVQILRQKRQNELANRPWIPAGPIHNAQYRPSSKYG